MTTTIPLSRKAQSTASAKLVCFADNAMSGGKLTGLRSWWDVSTSSGPAYGYVINAAKSLLIGVVHSARCQSHLDVLEAICIRAKQPILCQQKEYEPFSTAERSERVENFLFRATRKYTEAGIEQAIVAMRRLGANSPEPRKRAVREWHVSTQKTGSYITERSRLPGLIVGPCPSEESLCCPACPPTPPPPFLFADSRHPISKVRVLFPCICSPNCMYHTFDHITFLGYNHMNSRASVFLGSLLSEHIIRYHMCPWGRLLPGYRTRFFLQRGCCCQGKEVVPVDHIRGKGLSPRLPLGRKLIWQPVWSRAPKDPHLTV